MYPVLFRIGAFEITSFGAMVALGALAGFWVFRRELRLSGLPEAALDAAVLGLLCGFLGAKILYAILHLGEEPVLSLLLSRSGLAWCAGFGAIGGSSAATAATMGKIAIPEMKRYYYHDTLATGSVASAGTLGVMIPPSTVFLIYGILTEQSIGKLFIAGVLPGILLAFLMMITVAILCWRNPNLAPPGAPTSWKGRLKSLTGIIETLILFVFVIGGLFLGWFSPTQAGAIGEAGPW